MDFFMLETLKPSETTLKTTLTGSIKTKTDGFNVFSQVRLEDALNRQLQRLRRLMHPA